MKNAKKEEPAAVWVDVSELHEWGQNPRDNEKAIPEVAKSIKRFGFASPIIARKNGEIIAGHTRLKAAISLGLPRVPVRYLDLDPSEAHLLAIADNKVAEIADWSSGLADVLAELEADGCDLDGLGFEDDELEQLLEDSKNESFDDNESDDEPQELQEDVDSVPGTVYELGPHRLLCGDSTESESWDKLLLDGEEIQCVWTDPPYGVSYVGKTKDAMTIENDSLTSDDLELFLTGALGNLFSRTKKGASWYVASPAGDLFHTFGKVLIKLEVWRHTLVWVKHTFALGRSDYHYRHESIFYGWKPGGPHYFIDERTHDTVLEFDKPARNDIHPTMKPVALIEYCLGNSAKKGWIIGEPFGGSGSTLIAAAKLGMRARVIELDPKYCDAIRRRWTAWAAEHGVDAGTGAL